MGIIIKQGAKNAIFSYLGVIIGYLNLLQLYPLAMDASQIGLFRVIQDIAFLLMPFAQLGMQQSLVKYFPNYKNNENTLLANTFLISSVGFILLASIILLFQDYFALWFAQNSPEISNHFYLILLLTYLLILHSLLEAYGRSILETVFNTFVRDVLFRIMTGILVSLYFFEIISFKLLLNSIVLIYLSGVLLLYLRFRLLDKLKIQSLNFNFEKKGLTQIIKFGLFTMIGSGGIMLVGKIDSLMIASYLGLNATGIYAIAFFIAMVIEIPKRAIIQIVYPIISQAFYKNDMEKIDELYKKTALNLFAFGLLIFIGIWINVDNIYEIMPNGEIFKQAKWVILIVGIGKLIDMIAGVNGEILIMSKHYRYNAYFIGLLGIITVISNLILIPIMGIEGAALASLISLFVFNLLKLFFLKIKFNLQPFQWNLLKVIILGAATYYLVSLLPHLENTFLDLLLKSFATATLYIIGLLGLKISQDINEIANRLFLKLTGLIR